MSELRNGLPYLPDPITGPLNLVGNFSATGAGYFGGKVIAGSTTPDYAISKLQSNGALVVYGGAITNAPDAPSIVIDQQIGGVARIMASGTNTWAVPLCLNPYGGNVLVNTTIDAGAKFTVSKSNAGGGGAANAAIYLPLDESTIQGPQNNTQIRMGGNLVLGAASTMFLQIAGTSIAYAQAGILSLWAGTNFRLGTNFTAGIFASTGYVTIQDATGTTYKVLCAP